MVRWSGFDPNLTFNRRTRLATNCVKGTFYPELRNVVRRVKVGKPLGLAPIFSEKHW
jgi:hypothetical protein